MSVTPADRRRELPDEPGVYLFRDAARQGALRRQGEVDPQAGRVALLQPEHPRRARDLVPMIDQIEALVVHTEAEALLAEQNFIKQYKPRFNIRLRDDKSLPVHRDLASTRTSRACTSRASATAATARTSARTATPSGSARRSRCSARCSCSAPARGRSPGAAAARRASTTTSSAARRRASGT